MAWTKRQYIEQAFSEIGLAGYVFDLSPEQLQTALRQLDSMMATWDAKGVQVGWPVSITPGNADLDTEAPVIPGYDEAIYLNLAIRLAPGFGKVVGVETRSSAKMAYDALLLQSARPRQMQYPESLPTGAGAKPWRVDSPFIGKPNDDPLQIGDGGQLDFIGD